MPSSKRHKWSEEETELLKLCSREGSSLKQAAARLNRSPGAVSTRAYLLGIPLRSPASAWGRTWSSGDDIILRSMAKDGKTVSEISRETGRTPNAIYHYAGRSGINVDLPDPCNHISISEIAMAVLDGVLLSDGCLTPTSDRGSLLAVSQTPRRSGWLELIKEELEESQIESSIRLYERKERCIGGRALPAGEFLLLRTKSYAELHLQHQRWYRSGVKRVPRDLRLTPITVSHWFSGDGHGNDYGTLGFSTEGFHVSCVNFLLKRLQEDCGITAKKYRKNRQGSREQYHILVGKLPEALKLAGMMAPYLADCVQYKIKHVRKGRVWTDRSSPPIGGLQGG